MFEGLMWNVCRGLQGLRFLEKWVPFHKESKMLMYIGVPCLRQLSHRGLEGGGVGEGSPF